MSENLDQSALDALLHASPDELRAALNIAEHPVEPPAQEAAVEATTVELELPKDYLAQRNINVAAPGPQTELALNTQLENHIRALESWMAMIPDGQAKHGMRGTIEDMRAALQ